VPTSVTAASAYDMLAEIYDSAIPDPAGFADYYRAACGAGHDVLYVGCGTGRLLAALAVAGNRCVGVDPSAGMLARATARMREAGLADRVRLMQADAAQLRLDQQFDRVVFGGGAFEYLLSTRAQVAALRNLTSLLASGGSLHLDLAAPPHVTTNLRGNYTGEPDPQLNPRPRAAVTGSAVRLQIDHLRQLVRSQCSFERAGDAPPVETEYVTRYTTVHELRLLASVTGLRLTLFGGFHHDPVTRSSSNYVAEFRREADA
jgi:SAM-dependent methyltransferase